ncbi:flagellar assembly protein FliW [Paenibacillus pasadenensis]|uniref:flagellar assembly protein FliW n=1 Tax=Paenibacillus pasadenensis TaxID=217090 RepID=UPI0020404E2D|nr:flagellar assembly protein FliW [Paenibacillus pasadenensis]MCM3750194.1 flagellar assembly protein FliW [Paenibacillus pasadenensis]
MIIETTRFGAIEVRDKEVYTFPSGIPGFPEYKQYALIPVEDSPLFHLQSLEEGGLAFVAADPFSFYPDYEFKLPEQAERELELKTPEEVLVLNIVSIQGSLAEASLNLVAPVIFNTSSRTARQIILEGTSYTTRHALMQSEKPNEEEEA